MKGMDMKARIELELRGKDPHTIKELNLDSCRGQQLDGLNSDFINLETLSLINVGLTTLKGFPKFPNLRKLELSDNRISGGLDNLIGLNSLTHLNLGGNKLKDLDDLAPLAQLPSLKNLDLYNCEVTNQPNYREKIFELLPNLKFLDGFDQNEQEEDEFEDEKNDEDDDDDDENDDEDDDDDGDEDDDGDLEGEEDDEDDEDGLEQEDELVVSDKKNGINGNRVMNGKKKQINGKDELNGDSNQLDNENQNYDKTNDEGDENDEDDDVDEEDEDDEDDEVGLSYLQKENLEEDDDDEDFDEEKAKNLAANCTNEEEEDDEDDDEEDEIDNEIDDNNKLEDNTRSAAKKRKHEDTGDEDSKTQ